MDGAWVRGEVHTGFWWRDLREGDHLEDPDIDGRIMLKLMKEVGWGLMDWIDRAQDRERQWALVNVVINLRVP
jgi:hypothetical protein